MEILNRDSLCVMFWGGVFTHVGVYMETSHWNQDNLPQSLLHFIWGGGLVLLGFFFCFFFKLKLKLAIHFWLDWLTMEPLKDPPVFSHTLYRSDRVTEMHQCNKVLHGVCKSERKSSITFSISLELKRHSIVHALTVAIYTCFKKLRCELAYWGYTASKKDKLVTPEFGSQRNWSSRLGLSI